MALHNIKFIIGSHKFSSSQSSQCEKDINSNQQFVWKILSDGSSLYTNVGAEWNSAVLSSFGLQLLDISFIENALRFFTVVRGKIYAPKIFDSEELRNNMFNHFQFHFISTACMFWVMIYVHFSFLQCNDCWNWQGLCKMPSKFKCDFFHFIYAWTWVKWVHSDAFFIRTMMVKAHEHIEYPFWYPINENVQIWMR